MLDEDRIAAASRILHDHWRAGTKLEALEPSQRPQNRVDGYAIQAGIESQAMGKLFGWKIAATSEAGQRHINVDGPMAGRILQQTVIANTLKAGEVVTTGTCHPPLPIEAGDLVEADFGGIGKVSVGFA